MQSEPCSRGPQVTSVFDVGAEDEYIESDMALSVGVSAQYLAMESLRIWDEGGRGHAGENPGYAGAANEFEHDLDLDMSAEEMFGVAESASEPAAAPNAVDSLVESTAIHVEPVLESDASKPSVFEASLGGGEVNLAPIAELIDPSLEMPLPSLGLTAFDLEAGFGETPSAKVEDNAVANETPMSERVVQPAPTVKRQITREAVEQIQSPLDVEVPNDVVAARGRNRARVECARMGSIVAVRKFCECPHFPAIAGRPWSHSPIPGPSPDADFARVSSYRRQPA